MGVKSRGGFYKGLALLDVLLQFGQARFQQLLLFRGHLPKRMYLFNPV
jgi:hypothetical protein